MRTSLFLSVAVGALSALPGVVLAEAPEGGDDQAAELPPVTVIATRTETREDEAPATVTVFTARQIEEMLATDIKDLVRFEPGVSVPTAPARFGAALGSAGRDGNSGFTIRGLGGDRVLIVVDGVRTPDGFAFGAQNVGRGGYADLDLMKSVEILRGPVSALYGSDGVAGAVSFTTRDPEDLIRQGADTGLRARIGYNSADEGLTTSTAWAGRAGPISALIGWTHRDAHETQTQGAVGGVGSARTEANPQDIVSDAWLGKLVWAVAPGHSLRVVYDLYEAEMTADVLSGRSASVNRLLAEDTTRRERIGLDWRFKDVFGLESGRVSAYRQDAATLQFSAEDRTVLADRTRANSFDNEVYGVAADAVTTLTLGGVAHRLTFGGDWSETTQRGVRDGTVPPFGEVFPSSPFPKTDYVLAGAFVQDQISLLDGRLNVIPALRWDSYELSTASDPLYVGARADQSGDRVSPKLGLVWWTTPSVGLFANYAEGFKAPTPSQVNNGFSNLAFGYVSASNPNLRPETSRSYEIGVRFRDVPMFGGTFSGQAVAFQANYEDFISQQVVSGAFTPSNPAVYQYVNFTQVEVVGLEGKANLYWDNGVNARFAGAWAEGDSISAGVPTALSTIDPVKLVFGLGYDQPAGVWGGQAVVTWSAAKDSADTTGLGCFNANPALGCAVGQDFALLDLTAYWNVTDQVTARVGVFNVFDETYSWWSDIRGVTATSAVRDAYTQPGRNVGLTLSLRL